MCAVNAFYALLNTLDIQGGQHMTNNLTTEELEQFNAELIDDALDLVRDQLEEVA